MNSKLKVREIAEQTGLSTSTVSRVLSGKSNTSAQAKQRVLACAKQQGILTNITDGRLLFNALTIFAPPRAFDLRTDIFYYKVIEGIQSAVSGNDVRISYCGIEETDSDAPLFLKKISEPSCEVAILIGIDDPRIHEIAADIGKPCVLINGRDRSMRLDVVSPDHQLIGEFSANYLVEQGHRDILVLMCLRRSTMERRLRGIKDTLAQNGITFDDNLNLVATSGFGATEAREAISEYFSKSPHPHMPDAILVGGDFLAMGAMEALTERGLSVPADISIMSMDSINLSNIHDVPLTVVKVPRDDLGREAIRLLQRRITHSDLPPCSVLLNGHLMVRSSVKRISQRKQAAVVSNSTHGLYE